MYGINCPNTKRGSLETHLEPTEGGAWLGRCSGQGEACRAAAALTQSMGAWKLTYSPLKKAPGWCGARGVARLVRQQLLKHKAWELGNSPRAH